MRGYCAAGGGVHELREYCGEPRPVVEIDPEDREQLERLVKAVIVEAAAHRIDKAILTVGLRKGLRSLIAPPRPPEPQGIGAVVERRDGKRWVRGDRLWTNLDAVGVYLNWSHWEDVDTADNSVVRVLSEGVTP
jgi:hypothetical protein